VLKSERMLAMGGMLEEGLALGEEGSATTKLLMLGPLAALAVFQ